MRTVELVDERALVPVAELLIQLGAAIGAVGPERGNVAQRLPYDRLDGVAGRGQGCAHGAVQEPHEALVEGRFVDAAGDRQTGPHGLQHQEQLALLLVHRERQALALQVAPQRQQRLQELGGLLERHCRLQSRQ